MKMHLSLLTRHCELIRGGREGGRERERGRGGEREREREKQRKNREN